LTTGEFCMVDLLSPAREGCVVVTLITMTTYQGGGIPISPEMRC